MSGFVAEIKNKAKTVGEIELLARIADVRGERELKQFLTLKDVLAVLKNYVILPRKQLEEFYELHTQRSHGRVVEEDAVARFIKKELLGLETKP